MLSVRLPVVGEWESSQNQELEARIGVLLPRKTLGWSNGKPQEAWSGWGLSGTCGNFP